MTPLERLKAAEEAWLAGSEEEDFYFSMFEEPKRLRRSRSIRGALSLLVFGGYEALDGQWVKDERAVWLGMITSTTPGDGGRLSDALVQGFGRRGLALLGTPVALKPRDWDASHRFDSRTETRICWHLRHRFKVIQNGSDTRVVHAPVSHMLETQFSLK